MEEALKKVFIDVLGLPESTDFSELRYRGVDAWDSVAHMALVGEIESAFDVMLETQDVIDMSSFEKSKEILRKYGVDI